MNKTKILYLISSLAQGGAERHLLDLVRTLDRDRFDFDICVLGDQVHFRSDLPADQPRFRLGGRVWFSPVAFLRLVRAIDRARPQILHTYLNDANLWGRLSTLNARDIRVVTSVHLDDMPMHYRLIERTLASRSDRIVAHSASVARLLIDRVGVAPSRVVVIPNGVDTERYRPATAEQSALARGRFGLALGDMVALMPARISPQKNHDVVVEALAILRRQDALPDNFKLLLAGRVSSRRYHRRVRHLITAGGLQDVVRFLGPVQDMPALYAAADFVLMPSQTEASPIAALESLASGIPLLLSAAANADAVLVDGVHGWELKNPTAASVAEALRMVLAQPPLDRLEMGRRARSHMVAGFTTARVGADFERLYQALLPPH